MSLGLVGGHATLRMLRTISMLQDYRVWNSFARRRDRGAPGSGGEGRRRAFDDGLLIVCCVAFVGLIVLGSLLMLLVWTTAALPPRTLDACPEFGHCATPATDGNEPLWADDPRTDELRMSR